MSPPDALRPGHDYVLVGRRAALALPFERMMQEFGGALRRAHAGKRDGSQRTMNDQKNMILAIGLSMAVILAWQFFIGMPQMEKQKQEQQLRQQQTQTAAPGTVTARRNSPAAPRKPGQGGAPAAPAQAADARAGAGASRRASQSKPPT